MDPEEGGDRPPSHDLTSRVRANVGKWRRCLEEFDQLEESLAAERWPQEEVSVLTSDTARRLQQSERVLAQFARRVGQDDPARVLASLSQRESDLWLWAAVHLTIARAAATLMWDVAGRRFPEMEESRRAVCEAYLAVWRLAPILSGIVMSDISDDVARDRAAVALSSWLATGVKAMTGTELHRALTEDGAPFWLSLLERLPAAVVTAWYELKARGDTPTSEALLSRATYLLQREGRHKRVRVNGTDRLISPAPFPEDPDAVEDDGEAEALMLRLEAEEAYAAVMAVLSPQEAEVWSLRQAGYGYAEISERLGVKTGTVGGILSRVGEKIEKLRPTL